MLASGELGFRTLFLCNCDQFMSMVVLDCRVVDTTVSSAAFNSSSLYQLALILGSRPRSSGAHSVSVEVGVCVPVIVRCPCGGTWRCDQVFETHLSDMLVQVVTLELEVFLCLMFVLLIPTSPFFGGPVVASNLHSH